MRKPFLKYNAHYVKYGMSLPYFCLIRVFQAVSPSPTPPNRGEKAIQRPRCRWRWWVVLAVLVCCWLFILICQRVLLLITVSVSFVCLRCLGCRLGVARRMMNGRRQGAGVRGRPQGWGCGGGTIRAAPMYIYINLCERAFFISKIIFVASRKRSSQEGGAPFVK